MSPRELAILILGLAIVAVVLRGLYVALNGRRGQIRMAIDKNIPRDVDLNALELAELPSGGARVVARSLAEVNRQNHAVASASAKAAKINLGERKAMAAPIPVLMDLVTLNTEKLEAVRSQPEPVAVAAPVALGTAAVVASTVSEIPVEQITSAAAAINPNQAAAHYQDDNDYDDEDDDDYEDDYEDEDHYEDDMDEDEDYGDSQEDDDDFEDDEDQDEEDDEEDYDDEELDEDDYDPLDEDEDDLIDSDMEDELGYVDDDSDEFSMTAGERIGFSPAISRPAHQISLLNDEEIEATKPDQSDKRKSLFGTFSRKPNPAETQPREASPSISGIATITATPGPAMAGKPKLAGKPQVIVARPKPARVAPVRESLKTKETKEIAAEPVYDKAVAEPSEVVVLNAMAKSGRVFTGDDLLYVLITSGMKFGDMNIFHRRLGGDSKGPVIFSIANILNPGTFDLNRMHEFTTVGVSLFLAMPTPIKNLEAFEQMFGVAQQICSSLDGDLRDDNRNLMTTQTMEHYRQRIRDYELRRLKSIGARG